MGGHYVSNIQELQKDNLFEEALRSNTKKETYHKTKNYQQPKGIILKKIPGGRVFEVIKFRKMYHDFIFINDKIRQHIKNKYKEDMLFSDQEITCFRPRAVLCKKEYDSNLTKSIINEINANWYVIKPLNSSRSNGVIVTAKEDLDGTLKRILPHKINNNSYRTSSYRPKHTLTFGYWKGDKNNTFLIEEYAPSKTITVNNKLYDPTCRIVVLLRCINGEISLTFLDGFWKIPPKSLTEKGSLTDKHVSKYRDDFDQLCPDDLKISEEDWKQITTLFEKILTTMYKNILEKA